MDSRIPARMKAQTWIVDADFEIVMMEAAVDGGDDEQNDGDDDVCPYRLKLPVPNSLLEAH